MGSLRVRHDWATSLSLFTFHALEKEMATHSSVLAWRIPGTGEPGGLPSTGSHRVRHNWSDLAAAANPVGPNRYRFDRWVGMIPWRRKWQPTPVFSPGESYGQRRLAGYSPWGREESDKTEHTYTHTHTHIHMCIQPPSAVQKDWEKVALLNTGRKQDGT